MRYFLITGTALKTPPRRHRISQVISVSFFGGRIPKVGI
jgi:hypothetical protein